MSHLAQQRNRLQPAETLFYALPFLLADAIARVLRGAPINRAAALPRQVLRHVRRHAHVPAFAHKLRSIETLVTVRVLLAATIYVELLRGLSMTWGKWPGCGTLSGK